MIQQIDQDETINCFLDVIKVSEYIWDSRGKRDNCNCKDCRNTNVIALYTSCHYQKILLMIFMALLISAIHAKGLYTKMKC